MVAHEPARALKALEHLLAELESEAVKSVGDWHVDQTLEVFSAVQSQLGNHRQSADAILRVAERHQQHVAYSQRAFVAACATAALELALAGDRTGALCALRTADPVAVDLRPQERAFRRAQKVVAAMPRGGSGTSRRRTAALRRLRADR